MMLLHRYICSYCEIVVYVEKTSLHTERCPDCGTGGAIKYMESIYVIIK